MNHRKILCRGGAALSLCVFTMTLAPGANARSRGISSVGCSGCHGNEEDVSVSFSPMVAELGKSTSLRVTISDSNAEVAGVFIGVDDTSSLSIPGGEKLAIVGDGISHTSPTRFSGGQVTYEINWDVPSTPGAMRFTVSGIAGDGNGRNSNDEGFLETFDIVYGCEPAVFYQDFDGDGYGREGWPRTLCAGSIVEGLSPLGNDCDDNNESVHPDADEFCNQRDDDCDGQVDEDALPVELYPDADGDGFYSIDEWTNGEMELGCLPFAGYAAEGGDCRPEEASIHPGAEEVCDQYNDENCDGRVDERVRPICGVGWCRRESYSCSLDDCYPGDPVDEVCNFMDDDCDNEIDEGELCPEGEQCLAGECRPAEIGITTDEDGTTTFAPGTDPDGASANSGESHSSSPCTYRPSRQGSWWVLLAFVAWGALRRRRDLFNN